MWLGQYGVNPYRQEEIDVHNPYMVYLVPGPVGPVPVAAFVDELPDGVQDVHDSTLKLDGHSPFIARQDAHCRMVVLRGTGQPSAPTRAAC